jgi:hypothetical protein
MQKKSIKKPVFPVGISPDIFSESTDHNYLIIHKNIGLLQHRRERFKMPFTRSWLCEKQSLILIIQTKHYYTYK